MEIDYLAWGIGFLFFLPLHFGAPLLYLLLQSGPTIMRSRVPGLLLWGTVSAVLGFGLALLFWPHNKTWSAVAIALAFILPWLELFFKRKNR
jgi:hypothetical protein